MKKLSLILIVTLMSVGAAEARRKSSSKNQTPDYPRDSHHCASYECSDKYPIDPADDGYLPPFAGENENDDGHEGDEDRETGSDYIHGMPY